MKGGIAMPKYTVWTNATEKEVIFAPNPGDAAGKYHKRTEMPKNWDGSLIVRDDESGEEITFRRKQKAA